MIHFLLLSFFFCFPMYNFHIEEDKIAINISLNRLDINTDSSEVVITAKIKNNTNKTYYTRLENGFSTCPNNGYFWNISINFNDSTQLYYRCALVNYYPSNRWGSFKLRKGTEEFVTFKINLKTLVSDVDHVQKITQNTHFGNYSVTVSYRDRDRLNNKHETEVFTSNKIYFTYQK